MWERVLEKAVSNAFSMDIFLVVCKKIEKYAAVIKFKYPAHDWLYRVRAEEHPQRGWGKTKRGRSQWERPRAVCRNDPSIPRILL